MLYLAYHEKDSTRFIIDEWRVRMSDNRNLQNKKQKKKPKKLIYIFVIEIMVLLLLFGTYHIYVYIREMNNRPADQSQQDNVDSGKLNPEELAVKAEQERLLKEMDEMKDLIAQADQLAKGYDYDKAIELLKGYQGSSGGYRVYTSLVNAVDRLEKEKTLLKPFGGSYNSVFEISHLYFRPLIADPAMAFDGDSNSKTYNQYNITVNEFRKILQILYKQGYVLIRMSDIADKTLLEDGSFEYTPGKIYLRDGKKPIIISEDDVTYYTYMQDDGIASRLVLDDEGKPVSEMLLEDGTPIIGAFDIVPIINDFVEEHPDFSYKGAKGLLTLTGYKGIMGYRTDDSDSPTYEADQEAVRKLAEALKADGWDFGCLSWGYNDMKAAELDLLESDTNRWLKEVGSLVGPTEIYVFPYGNDIEGATGSYKGEKYKFLKNSGFNMFLGVYKEPWMHVKKAYIRMTRRPVDGQALLEYPERLKDLFNVREILDPQRPSKDW